MYSMNSIYLRSSSLLEVGQSLELIIVKIISRVIACSLELKHTTAALILDIPRCFSGPVVILDGQFEDHNHSGVYQSCIWHSSHRSVNCALLCTNKNTQSLSREPFSVWTSIWIAVLVSIDMALMTNFFVQCPGNWTVHKNLRSHASSAFIQELLCPPPCVWTRFGQWPYSALLRYHCCFQCWD